MEVEERFVIKDLMDNAYSVSWPGYEFDVCNNELKATNLLKILFEELNLEDAELAVSIKHQPEKSYIVNIPWMTYHQNPGRAGGFLVHKHAVVAVKFPALGQAEQFKLIMERRLAWRRLGGKTWQ